MRSVFVGALLVRFNCDIICDESLISLLPSHELQIEYSKLYGMHMAEIDTLMSVLQELLFCSFKEENLIKLVIEIDFFTACL